MQKTFPDRHARQSLAQRLGLPYDDAMQDWEWEVAIPEQFEQYLALYLMESLNDAERFSLMEMLVQCVEDSDVDDVFESRWVVISVLLERSPSLHARTIQYWSSPDEHCPEGQFKVAEKMRSLSVR